MILIFGSASDKHVATVIDHLDQLGVAHNVVDIHNVSAGGLTRSLLDSVEVSIGRSNRKFSPKLVWWRVKPAFQMATESLEAFYDQQFALHEWTSFLACLPELLEGCVWINPRQAEREASSKVRQLSAARKAGLHQPKTLVGNDVDRIVDFVRALKPQRCVHKTFTPYISPSLRQKYTGFITEDMIRDRSDAVGYCPSIFQEYIEPEYELRVTIVGSKIFPVRIDKLGDVPDWRQEIFNDIYTLTALPTELEHRLLMMHKSLGLVFAAYDLIVDRHGRAVFLEVNPGGQWLWLESRLDLPISRALAEYMCGSFVTP